MYTQKKKTSDISGTIHTIFRLTPEEEIFQRCEALEDYYRCKKDQQILLERALRERDQAERELAIIEKSLAEDMAAIEHMQNILRKHGINPDETE